LTKKQARRNRNIYSLVLTALAATFELSIFDLRLSAKALIVHTEDA
jgi:hypothetical protein